MNDVWALTIAANLTLMIVLVVYRAWQRFPIFFGSQLLVIGCDALLVYAYYSQTVTQAAYHEGWLASDELCILLATFSAWEIWERCSSRLLCLLAIILMLHAGLTLWEYRVDVYSTFAIARVRANIFITFALSIVVYLEHEQANSHTAPYTHA